ncbi:PH domain-containing protein [Rathayibacter soli]|uniref:PH domain-containing protein n=1 Tax=Rathayibacter soli TaxID=3144168 RepID=UPI0027E5B857|nr:PH domain-containing protein [Glaciibacter superstes]
MSSDTPIPELAPIPEPAPGHDAAPWHRLNPRMLLVHPIRELIRYLPLLVIALVAGSVGGEPWWTYVISGLGIVVGILRWFTTTFRITSTHVEVRRGLLNRRTLSVPRDRIRSVDVDATLLHRLFGVAIVKVGTSASHGQDGLDFDAVAATDVPALRAELLRMSALQSGGTDAPPRPANLSHWRLSWARYAPFTLVGVGSLIAVAVFALQIQFFDGGLPLRVPVIRDGVNTLARVPTLPLVLWGALVLIVAASVVALVRYVLSYSGFALTRSDSRTLHIGHGLLRTRQATLDERRLRGVSIGQPLSLRLVGAASAHAIMTGLGRERGGEAIIEPPGPSEEAFRVADAVLGTDAPLRAELAAHGPRAHWRRYTRAASALAILAAAVAVAQLLGYVLTPVWWLFVVLAPFFAYLAADRFRGLGHAVLPGWLVTRSGSLARKHVVLETAGIIGWTVRRSIFQRRAGLATLIATTAAGKHKYEIPDLPMDQVWPLIESISVTPAEH